jgi:uncharacterized protein YeeX (DUF496 family)
MSKKLQRDIDNIRKHLAVGNKESAQRIADFLIRSAPTDKARTQIITALKEI